MTIEELIQLVKDLSSTREDCVIGIRKTTQLLGRSRAWTYAKMDVNGKYFDADFPRPIRLGPKAIGWKLSEIMAYINSRERA